MNRYQNGTATPIDQLTYVYNNTNQLQTLTDNSGSNTGVINGVTSFVGDYDANGNLTTDPSKPIGTINTTYNLLNLPMNITGAKTITYTYDATGNKLRRVSTGTGNTDYINGIEYDGGALNFIQTEEGRAVVNGSTYTYYYDLGDNLGNTRVTFTNGGYAQVDDYYPFGMEISRWVSGTKDYYLYNRKELQPELTEYDYGARFYDPVIGRWNTVDPLAEKSRRWSPYNYVLNNPISLTDPDGMTYLDGIYENGLYGNTVAYSAGDNGPMIQFNGTTYDNLNSFFDTHKETPSAFDKSTGETIGINPYWSDLPKSELLKIARAFSGLTGGQLQNYAGNIFERAFQQFMTTFSNKGYYENSDEFPTTVNGRRGVVPDGISAALIAVTNGIEPIDSELIPNTSWYEVKATSSTISKSSFGNQAWGLVNALYIYDPQAATQGFSSLTFVTTSDATISPSLVASAKSDYNINIWQFRAIYRQTDSGIKVSFYDPDNSSFLFRYNWTRPFIYLGR